MMAWAVMDICSGTYNRLNMQYVYEMILEMYVCF